MIVTKNNIFPGAKISYLGNSLIVYKVNGSSFYAGTLPIQSYNTLLTHKASGVTLQKYLSLNGILNYKYSESFTIEEEEANKKEIVLENAKVKSAKLTSVEYEAIKDYKKAGKDFRLSYIYTGKSIIRFITKTADENAYLLNIDNSYYLVDITNDETALLGDIKDIDFTEDNIPWGKLSRYSTEEKVEIIKPKEIDLAAINKAPTETTPIPSKKKRISKRKTGLITKKKVEIS